MAVAVATPAPVTAEVHAAAPAAPTGAAAASSSPAAGAAPPVIPGARMLGKYIMLETLGEGGFSKVKLGIDTVTKEKVALKMLKKDKLSMSSASVRKQVEREITAMAKIQHPNVIRLREVDWSCQYEKRNGKKRDIILVVLELATGGELFEFLNFTGPFEEAIARTYFHQLMAGISHAHAAGVAHRDLKPENLLLDHNFVLKLADFGFSNVFAESDRLMFTECGTPGYMAPEMIKNSGYDPTVSDIWACGVILFIMLAGFPPFQKPNVTDWWFQKLATNKHHLFWQAHSRNAYFSDATKDFINKILTPDPTKRITLADMKKHPWFMGTTISHAALVTELTRRKNDVDAAKAREKAEKKKRAEDLAAAAAAGGAGALAATGAHAADRGDDDLPLEAPSMWGRAAEPVAEVSDLDGGGMAMGAGAADLDGGACSAAPEEKSERKTAATPPLYVPSGSVACYTRFESHARADVLMSRIIRTLGVPGSRVSVEDSQFKLKASVLTPVGSVAFAIQVFLDASAPTTTHVVEFRRRAGDSMHYFSIFNEIRDALTDIIVHRTAPAVGATAEAAAAAAAAAPAPEAAKAAPAAAAAAGAPAPAAEAAVAPAAGGSAAVAAVVAPVLVASLIPDM